MSTGTATFRGPRPRRIGRAPGIDYGDLDAYLGYLLRRAQLAAFENFFQATAGARVTPPRFTALVILEANPGITQSLLGAALGTARSGATLLTNWLVERGYAQRRHRPDDARVWGLYLTARGAALLDRLRPRIRQRERALVSRLSGRERALLTRLLTKLAG
ncbi:MAG TPA: MarR family transcriptional regulator [Burkholderiales bacterium]|nr:MarR family transcriptional regulator [Burkholderiales bacterium]